MKRTFFGYGGVVLLMFVISHGSIAAENTSTNVVTIDNFNFKPQTLTVTVGTKVTWINHDDVPHTVVSTDKKTIVSPALDTDEKFSYTFSTAGTNDYHCSVHPKMKGTIIVQ
jgi:plastocyanin